MIPNRLEKPRSKVQLIDSCGGEYAAKKISVIENEDQYAGPFQRESYWQDYIESPITLGGVTGKLITYRTVERRKKREKVTNVTMLRLRISDGGVAGSVLVIRTDQSVDPDIVKTIRESFRLKK